MLPYLSLVGRLLPPDGVLGMAGLGFGLLAALLRCKRFGLSRDDCAYLYILGAVGALVGAKLLYLLPLLPRLAVELPLLWEEPGEFYARYLSGGMVFYGGFFGGVAAAWGAAKYLRLRLSDFFPVLVPALPLGHSIHSRHCRAQRRAPSSGAALGGGGGAGDFRLSALVCRAGRRAGADAPGLCVLLCPGAVCVGVVSGGSGPGDVRALLHVSVAQLGCSGLVPGVACGGAEAQKIRP